MEYPLLESAEFFVVFIIMAPDILHRGVEIEFSRYAGDRNDVFGDSERRDDYLLGLVSFNFLGKTPH